MLEPLLDIELALIARPTSQRLMLVGNAHGLSTWLEGPARHARLHCAVSLRDDPEPTRWQIIGAERHTPSGDEIAIAQSAPLRESAANGGLLDLLATQCVVDYVALDTLTDELAHVMLCFDQTERSRPGLVELFEREQSEPSEERDTDETRQRKSRKPRTQER